MTFEEQALHDQIVGTLEGLDILREAGDLRRAKETNELAEAKARARLRPVYLTPTSDSYAVVPEGIRDLGKNIIYPA